ncbi:MAG: hypothetical protein ACOYK9_02015 [Chlamydiia bacterium]
MFSFNPAESAVHLAIDYNQIVNSSIGEKQQELEEISVHLKNDATLLRKLRNYSESKKSVDLREIRQDIEKFQKQHEEIQNGLSNDLKSTFDFQKLQLDKVENETLLELIEEVELAKTQLQNRVQPSIMEIEAKIQLMKLLSEICKLIVNQQTEAVRNWISRAGR